MDGVSPAEEFVTVTVTANYEFGGTLLNTLLNNILGSNRVPTDIRINESGYWTKVGVVVRATTASSMQVFPFRSGKPELSRKRLMPK